MNVTIDSLTDEMMTKKELLEWIENIEELSEDYEGRLIFFVTVDAEAISEID